MQLLIFRIIYPFLWVISKMPWRIFYLFSDVICFFVYHIIRYRKKVVTENLRLAFPDKSDTEIFRIRRKFYTHMCDMFLEMIKSISISEEESKKRFKFKNLEDLHKLERADKSCVILAAHYASYEWSNTLDLIGKHIAVGVYKPIKNIHFDKLVKKIRGRFGSVVIANKNVVRFAIQKEREGKDIYSYGLIADQSPKLLAKNYWSSFMGHIVPVFEGGEVLAKKLNLNVAYLKVEKVKRGHYEAEVVIITEDINSLEKYDVTEKYLRLLEAQIHKQPEYYLWTHKRWKHRRN